MKSRKSRIIIILIVVIVLIGIGAGLIKKKQSKLAKAPRYGLSPAIVHVASAKNGDLDINLTYLAVVEPFQKADISSRASASIVSVNVYEGDRVRRGDILIVLDAKDIHSGIDAVSAQVKQAKANLASNKATVEALDKSAAYWGREAMRDSALAKDGAIPEAQAEGTVNKADEIKGRRDSARRMTDALYQTIRSLVQKKSQLTAQLAYYIIPSPLDGVVTRRLVDPGDLASPGRTLITVEDTNRMMPAFDVPQQDLDRIREGLPVTFQINGKVLHATLSHLFPALAASRMARAEVYIDGPDKALLTSGAYVPLTVQLMHIKDVTLVPPACLVANQNEQPYVYVIQDEHVAIRPVEILGDGGKLTAIKGVKAGEQVVLNTFLGWARLAQGMPVEVTK